LVGVTIVWGSSFVVVKNVYEESPPLHFLFWRFLLATALLAPFLFARRRSPGPGAHPRKSLLRAGDALAASGMLEKPLVRRSSATPPRGFSALPLSLRPRRARNGPFSDGLLFRDGLILGLLLAGGIALQVLGIPDTTASNAAFLTGLSVVLTPFVAYLRTKKLPSLENTVGITLAGAGFALLTFPASGSAFNRGDTLLFLCGIVFAFYIVELAERAGRHDAFWLTALQLVTVVVFAAVLSLVLRAPLFSGSPLAVRELRPVLWQGPFLWGVLYLGSIGTVGTFFGQTWAQRHMSATHAAIIFALEPVAAALLAAWFLDERLSNRGAAGAVLVVAGIVVAELRLRRGVRPDQPSGKVSV